MRVHKPSLHFLVIGLHMLLLLHALIPCHSAYTAFVSPIFDTVIPIPFNNILLCLLQWSMT